MVITKEGVESIINDIIDSNYTFYLSHRNIRKITKARGRTYYLYNGRDMKDLINKNNNNVPVWDCMMIEHPYACMVRMNAALHEYFDGNFFGENQIDFIYRNLLAHASIFEINNYSDYLSYRNQLLKWMSKNASREICESTEGFERTVIGLLISILRLIEIIYSRLCFNIDLYTFSPIYENCDAIRQVLRDTFRDDNIMRTLYEIVIECYKDNKEIEKFMIELRQESTKIFPTSDYAAPLCDVLEQTLREMCLFMKEKA